MNEDKRSFHWLGIPAFRRGDSILSIGGLIVVAVFIFAACWFFGLNPTAIADLLPHDSTSINAGPGSNINLGIQNIYNQAGILLPPTPATPPPTNSQPEPSVGPSGGSPARPLNASEATQGKVAPSETSIPMPSVNVEVSPAQQSAQDPPRQSFDFRQTEGGSVAGWSSSDERRTGDSYSQYQPYASQQICAGLLRNRVDCPYQREGFDFPTVSDDQRRLNYTTQPNWSTRNTTQCELENCMTK
ncbi:MAG: hypothetical protein JSR78_09650 [Proteobacteria bacterium]|nr:hypothetical protein [Pseudomonadota bacterium]